MKKRKLGIIGGSGLYKMEGFEKFEWKKINTPWGKPSDEILLTENLREGENSKEYSKILVTLSLVLYDETQIMHRAKKEGLSKI